MFFLQFLNSLYVNFSSIEESENGKKIEMPKECAVKVFKTTLNEFKTRDKYIRDDYRFKDRFSKQVSPNLICKQTCDFDAITIITFAYNDLFIFRTQER